jgi:F420-0:gamma-glutamyl ligase
MTDKISKHNSKKKIIAKKSSLKEKKNSRDSVTQKLQGIAKSLQGVNKSSVAHLHLVAPPPNYKTSFGSQATY